MANAELDIRPASLEVAAGLGARVLDACGLWSRRPESMVDVPAFETDRLDAQLSGGDLWCTWAPKTRCGSPEPSSR